MNHIFADLIDRMFLNVVFLIEQLHYYKAYQDPTNPMHFILSTSPREDSPVVCIRLYVVNPNPLFQYSGGFVSVIRNFIGTSTSSRISVILAFLYTFKIKRNKHMDKKRSFLGDSFNKLDLIEYNGINIDLITI